MSFLFLLLWILSKGKYILQIHFLLKVKIASISSLKWKYYCLSFHKEYCSVTYFLLKVKIASFLQYTVVFLLSFLRLLLLWLFSDFVSTIQVCVLCWYKSQRYPIEQKVYFLVSSPCQKWRIAIFNQFGSSLIISWAMLSIVIRFRLIRIRGWGMGGGGQLPLEDVPQSREKGDVFRFGRVMTKRLSVKTRIFGGQRVSKSLWLVFQTYDKN